jgi:hypothetical protein
MITNEQESFFLTNEQEAKAAERLNKQKRLKNAGEPLKLGGKALDVAISPFGVFVAESCFAIEQIDLNVIIHSVDLDRKKQSFKHLRDIKAPFLQ